LEDIFAKISQQDSRFKVECSYLEVHNDKIYDLLGSTEEGKYEELNIYFSGKDVIKDLQKEEVSTWEEALSTYEKGKTKIFF
jgi:hypothetical protein